jgi:hypothetical protein
VQEAGAAWRAATSTVAGVGELMQRTEDGRRGRVLSDRAVGWHRVRSVPGTWRLETRVFWLSLKIKVDVAASELPRAGQRELEPQDTWWPRSCPGGYRQVFASFASKLVATVSPGLSSKLVVGFLG